MRRAFWGFGGSSKAPHFFAYCPIDRNPQTATRGAVGAAEPPTSHFRSTWPRQNRCQLHKFAASLLWQRTSCRYSGWLTSTSGSREIAITPLQNAKIPLREGYRHPIPKRPRIWGIQPICVVPVPSAWAENACVMAKWHIVFLKTTKSCTSIWRVNGFFYFK